jgi:AraC-like DNA-binding protein
MTEFAVPVMEGNRHVATVVSGQVFLKQPSEEEFSLIMARFGPRKGKKWRDHAREVFFGTPVVPEERLKAVVRLLESFASQLSARAGRHALISTPVEHRAVRAAKEYVEQAKGEITLDHILDHVHVSRFHFCKIFRKNTGMTFTEYVNRFRLTKAKELLADPALRISDVAYGAGFGSVARFNALFRREMKMSPTVYRRTLAS